MIALEDSDEFAMYTKGMVAKKRSQVPDAGK
jgi:hypothetical protein